MILNLNKHIIKASVFAASLLYLTTVKEFFRAKPSKKDDVALPLSLWLKRIVLRFYRQKCFLTDRKILENPSIRWGCTVLGGERTAKYTLI